MPKKCCVPLCRSNYEKPYVSVFKFPNEDSERNKWLKNIPRKNLVVTKDTVVCMKHFEPEYIVTIDSVKRQDGSILSVPRQVPKLANGAVPTLFSILPAEKEKIIVGLEDEKDYAENTMNELLGWYGYGKVGTVEAQNLISRRPSSSSSSPQRTEVASPKSRGDDISDDVSDPGSSLDAAGSEATAVDGDSGSSNPNVTIVCAWCQKKGLKLFTLKTSSGQFKTFCSELCFDQCRRAAFKKNRTCDWCKHVRHTVNYVDFQDKDHQLQFCSDKCLNQYKMNIFCKETQAYLQLHPQEAGNANPGCSRSNSPNLITPDLWLRDCKESENGGSDDETAEKIQVKQEPHSPVEEQCDPNDLTLKQSDKLPVENSVPSKPDPPKPAHERRKKSHVADKEHSEKPERRSSRLRPVAPKLSIRPSQRTLVRSPNKHFLPDNSMLRPISPSSSYPHQPLINGTLSSRSTASNSPVLPQPLPVASSSAVQSGLPPPPPLLNTELFQQPFLPSQVYQQPQSGFLAQQQLEAYLAMQNNFRMRLGLTGQRPVFPEQQLPSVPLNLSSPGQAAPNTLGHPASVMLPYPLVIPFPVPIPIPVPLPLSHFLNVKQSPEKTKPSSGSSRTTTTEEQAKRVDDIISKLMTKIYAQSVDHGHNGNSRKSKNDQACAADSSVVRENDSKSVTSDTLKDERELTSSRKSKHQRISENCERSKRTKLVTDS